MNNTKELPPIVEIPLGSEDYPVALAAIKKPPKILYCIGSIELLHQKLLAIVGKRKYSDFGKNEAWKVVEYCKKAGLVTVSGMAAGVDQEVHRSSLKQGVPTIAVLPLAVDNPRPVENTQLYWDIIASGGLVISEFASGQKYFQNCYIVRNRIIAGLSRATVVVEASFQSGSINTAHTALEYGREVFVCMRGQREPGIQGNFRLLTAKIGLPISPNYGNIQAVFEDAEFVPALANLRIGLSPLEEYVISLLDNGVEEFSAICSKVESSEFAGIDASELSVCISKLELEGLLARDEFGRLSPLY